MGYLWKLAYEEIKGNKHNKGTYCETIICSKCKSEFYFNDTNIIGGQKLSVHFARFYFHVIKMKRERRKMPHNNIFRFERAHGFFLPHRLTGGKHF